MIAIVGLVCAVALGAAPASLLVKDVTVVSAHQVENLPSHNVLIRDGRILNVSPDPIDTPNNCVVIDGEGLYLTPGLMDSHVHVSLIPGLGFVGTPRADAHPELAEDYLAQQPRSLLYHGVTQILDPNPGLAWREFAAANPAPALFRCEVITSRQTYPFIEQSAEVSEQLYPYLLETTDGAESPSNLVARIAASGAIGVKLYFENGFGDQNHWPLLEPGVMDEIVTAAHSRGLPVVAHANAWDMYQVALDHRVDVLMHGLWNMAPETATNDDLLGRIAQTGTAYMPTLRTMEGLVDLMRPDLAADAAYAAIVPPSLLAWYGDPEAQWFRDELLVDFGGLESSVVAQIMNRISGRGENSLQNLYAAGAPLLLGSDCPGSPGHGNQPGLSTLQEIQGWARAGISPADVLTAATITNAREFGLDEDYGTIETGKIANLLLLRVDPLVSVDAWDSIAYVILRGEVIDRESLRVPVAESRD